METAIAVIGVDIETTTMTGTLIVGIMNIVETPIHDTDHRIMTRDTTGTAMTIIMDRNPRMITEMVTIMREDQDQVQGTPETMIPIIIEDTTLKIATTTLPVTILGIIRETENMSTPKTMKGRPPLPTIGIATQ